MAVGQHKVFSAKNQPNTAAAAAAKSLQSCPTLCDPIDGSLPGSPVPGILQARTLEWVAISFSSAWKWKVTVKSFSHVRLLATPWTAAYQAPPSMAFSRQEYWSGSPVPSPKVGIHQVNILSKSNKQEKLQTNILWMSLFLKLIIIKSQILWSMTLSYDTTFLLRNKTEIHIKFITFGSLVAINDL